MSVKQLIKIALAERDMTLTDVYKQLKEKYNKEYSLQNLSSTINPETEFDDMDITEKLMLLSYISKSEEERKRDEEEAIPFEEILKEEGLTIDDLQD